MATVPSPNSLSMLTVLGSVKGFLKRPSVYIDNGVFRLHYKATTTVLLVCLLLVSLKQYIGDPIHCIVDQGFKSSRPAERMAFTKAIETYCWITSTFSVPKRAFKKIGEIFPYPGVATPEEGEELKYHKYYQWVAFTLFFQAMCFYFPHYLWKTWEVGKCEMLVQDLKNPVTTRRRSQLLLIADNFVASLHYQNVYAIRFFCCEVLNLINVVAQIFFTDLFLGYEFTTYGYRVVEFAITMDQEDRPDPMSLVFPRVTKCTFHDYGASGTVQRIDALCVLPINILNEKIYVMLWFWFIILALVTLVALLMRLAMLVSPQVRHKWLKAQAKLAPEEDVACVARKCQIGDWFVLCQIGKKKNMDPIAFNELISILAKRFEGKGSVNGRQTTANADVPKDSNISNNV